MIFLSADLNQVENRIELMLTRDPAMIELARTPPWELDMHSYNAATIAPEPPRDSPAWKPWRYLGKKTNHAGMRGVGAKRFSDELLKDGVFKTPEECQRLLDAYYRRYAPLNNYFSEVRRDIFKNRMLMSSWGEWADYRSVRLDDQVYQDGYSFYPQAEAGGLIANYGVKPTHAWCKRTGHGILHLQVHDQLLLSVRPEHAHEAALQIRSTLERPRLYGGELLTVPISFALGRSWGAMKEWQKLPSSPEEFTLND